MRGVTHNRVRWTIVCIGIENKLRLLLGKIILKQQYIILFPLHILFQTKKQNHNIAPFQWNAKHNQGPRAYIHIRALNIK